MTFECEQCGKECKQPDIQRFTLHFSTDELAALVPTKYRMSTAVIFRQAVADALAALRDEMRSDREPESGVYYEVDEARAYNRAIDADLARLDATFAALGLPEPATKDWQAIQEKQCRS